MYCLRTNLISIVLSASVSLLTLTPFVVSLVAPSTSFAWENGGRTRKLNDPKYGTHDWIAEEALKMLPEDERNWVDLRLYLLGTEAPDNQKIARRVLGKQAASCYGDPFQHHAYFDDTEGAGELIDDAACVRSQEEYLKAREALVSGDHEKASFFLGAMSHYLADLAAWPHVMGAYAVHGAEETPEHRELEDCVEATLTARVLSDPEHRSTRFSPYLVFDGSLELIEPYEAARQIGLRTHRGVRYSAAQMRQWLPMGVRGNGAYIDSSDWSQAYQDELGASLNHAVNGVADVIHTLHLETQTVPPDSLEFLSVERSD